MSGVYSRWGWTSPKLMIKDRGRLKWALNLHFSKNRNSYIHQTSRFFSFFVSHFQLDVCVRGVIQIEVITIITVYLFKCRYLQLAIILPVSSTDQVKVVFQYWGTHNTQPGGTVCSWWFYDRGHKLFFKIPQCHECHRYVWGQRRCESWTRKDLSSVSESDTSVKSWIWIKL